MKYFIDFLWCCVEKINKSQQGLHWHNPMCALFHNFHAIMFKVFINFELLWFCWMKKKTKNKKKKKSNKIWMYDIASYNILYFWEKLT